MAGEKDGDRRCPPAGGGRSTVLPLADIRELRLLRETPGGREVRLLACDGQHLTLREATVRAQGAFPDFAAALVERLSQNAPGLDFVLGPTRPRWIAALTVLVTAVAIMVAELWILATDGGLWTSQCRSWWLPLVSTWFCRSSDPVGPDASSRPVFASCCCIAEPGPLTV